MPTPLSGRQITIEHGAYSATIASVGASLRVLTHDGTDLVLPFAADEVRPRYRGAILAPWPNRVVDGQYEFAGEARQLALTEPERSHALHGLACWLDFTEARVTPSAVTLAATIEPQAGYPHRLAIEVDYELTDAGLRSEVRATNLGGSVAPFGTGPHPYLVAGDGTVDEWELSHPAATVMQVEAERLIPTGLAPVTPEFDFGQARAIGDVFIDHAFTNLSRGPDGLARVEVRGTGGRGVVMEWDERCPWLQIHTADLPDPAASRRALAVEPMTCPPDAFNSGVDVIEIAPGATTSAGWGIRAL